MTRLLARGLSFRYRKDTDLIFAGLDHQFDAGQMTAITGYSGSGKSTLLYVLALMTRPTSGEVLLDDERVDHLRDRERAALRANRFGFVFQDAALDPIRTVLDNVLEPAVYRGQARRTVIPRARVLLEEFGVEHRVDHRPGQISGGQAQRIALCRALLGDPSVIFADEPTGNLDPSAADVVLATLRRRADTGAIVIISTHDPVVSNQCDTHLRLGES